MTLSGVDDFNLFTVCPDPAITVITLSVSNYYNRIKTIIQIYGLNF